MGGREPTSVELWKLVVDERGRDDLRAYRGVDGGGDRHDAANRIAADDLFALRLLNMPVPPEMPIEFLDEGPDGSQVNAHLAHIPVDVELGSAAAAVLLMAGGHADQASSLIQRRGRGRGRWAGLQATGRGCMTSSCRQGNLRKHGSPFGNLRVSQATCLF